MMTRIIRIVSVALLVVSLASGCSDDASELDAGLPDTGADMGADAALDQLSPDMLDPECGPEVYPCGPYGTQEGDVAANMTFLGYADPENACKAHADKALDTSELKKLSFKDWYVGDPGCPNKGKELLWVMVSAGWCGPCQDEVNATATDYRNGAVDPRVGVFNIVFETDPPVKPVTRQFLDTWIQSFGLTFPVGMDPSFNMGQYFKKEAVPFNMLIETSTMEVYYRQTGGSLSDIGAKIQAYFAGN
jgi:hypothetical protein